MASETNKVQDQWDFPNSVSDVANYVTIYDENLWHCVFFVVWTPLYWNVICRWEYSTQVFSRLFGSAKLGCFCFSLTQILMSNLRNYYFKESLASQPHFQTPFNDELTICGYFVGAVGMALVVTSFLRLGWFGTWHGDHFGILLPAKVTGFPFSIMEHPMYDGAVLGFLGMSLISRSITGVLLAFWVHIVYKITELVEEPFTNMIYARAAAKSKKGGKKSR